MLWVGSNCIIWAGARGRWSLEKKILPCGLKIAQHSPSAEWGNVRARRSRWGWALQAAGWDTGAGHQPQWPGLGRQEREALSAQPVGGGGSRVCGPMTVLSPSDPRPQRGPGPERHAAGTQEQGHGPPRHPGRNLRSATRCLHALGQVASSFCASVPLSLKWSELSNVL